MSRVVQDCFKANYKSESFQNYRHFMPDGDDTNENKLKVSDNLFRTILNSNNPYHPKYQYLNKKLRHNLRKLKNSYMSQGSNGVGNIYKSEYHVYAEK